MRNQVRKSNDNTSLQTDDHPVNGLIHNYDAPVIVLK